MNIDFFIIGICLSISNLEKLLNLLLLKYFFIFRCIDP